MEIVIGMLNPWFQVRVLAEPLVGRWMERYLNGLELVLKTGVVGSIPTSFPRFCPHLL